AHEHNGELRRQMRVFRITLEIASCERVTLQIDRRPEQHLYVLGNALVGKRIANARSELDVPGCGETHADRKRGRTHAGARFATHAARSVRYFVSRNANARHAGAEPEARSGRHAHFFFERHLREQRIDPSLGNLIKHDRPPPQPPWTHCSHRSATHAAPTALLPNLQSRWKPPRPRRCRDSRTADRRATPTAGTQAPSATA